ncbi:MAG: MlaD family protein [Actinomycetota bacterium]|nr:MlaD family protein [Actinomycetota bacterium]
MPPAYDERIYRKGHPPHQTRNALILIALVLFGTYLAVTKSLPFGSEYELNATFQNAANIRKGSPVRIAGVNVGEVKGVRGAGDAAVVTFTVDDDGRPIREDAQVEIRPRIFLEGNFFLDVKPGSPSAPEISDDGSIPITQTSTAVQLDQILTSLQAPERENLQRLLQGYGQALNYEPTAADDKGQDPDVQGETAGQATNDAFVYGATGARDSAIVNEALQGTEPGDLRNLISSNVTVFDALLQREAQLKDFVTNLNTTVGAFAAESDNLAESVRLLAPTLERATPALRNTNATFPYLRAFARDIQPGLRELPATIAVSGPWLKQTRRLLRRDELGRLAYQLRLTGEPAAQAASAGVGLFGQTELLSRCVTNVLVPTGNVPITDIFDPANTIPNYKEFGYAVTGFAGETQNFDGNGPYLRFQTGGGSFGTNGGLVSSPNVGGGFRDETNFGRAQSEPLATQPVQGSKPPFRTDAPCYVNAIPDLNGPAAAPGPSSPTAVP